MPETWFGVSQILKASTVPVSRVYYWPSVINPLVDDLMTDETDVNCRRFIELEGLDVFKQCLDVRIPYSLICCLLLTANIFYLHAGCIAVKGQ